ncbi:zinc finger protein ZFPM1-like [Ylistrum balloti]|uniref:zinc finger protein ZFPM1-like n=1 Tax=Ylistrum balloti TaxID=509963 RepID=UPI002905B2A1|nr:zinc finger protein ZFPM1-like [Ylistrum balloti]
MSRRKQSNPKPLKRQSDSEDADDDMEEKLGSNDEDILDKVSPGEYTTLNPTSPVTDSDNSVDRKYPSTSSGNNDVTSDISNERATDNCVSPSELDFLKSLSFPSDILSLRKVEGDEALRVGRPYVVCTAIPLQKGSSIGPFLGEHVSLSSVRQGDLVLQAHSEDGEPTFIRVLERSGAWLSFLRPVFAQSECNASVFFEGGKIWCQMIEDLPENTEVMASFSALTCKEESVQESKDEDVDVEKNLKSGMCSPTKRMSDVSSSSSPSSAAPAKPSPSHAALLFGCPYCGVRFSSGRTLDGHLTYYCSKKPQDFSVATKAVDQEQPSPRSCDDGTEQCAERKRKSPSTPDSQKEFYVKTEPESPGTRSATESPPSKMAKLVEHYKCSFCSYTADKMSSLNRHMRIHNRGGRSQTEPRPESVPVPKYETYCKHCNIQFSSVSTFNCHKEFYCSRRSGSNDGTENGSDNSSPSPNPSAISPISRASIMDSAELARLHGFMGNSPFIHGQTRVIIGPPIVAPEGVSGMPTVIVQPVVSQISSSESTEPAVVSTSRRDCDLSTTSSTEQPLDLTTPRKQTESSEEHSDIVKSEPKSPNSPLNLKSPKSQASESPHLREERETTPVTQPIVSPALVPPLLPVTQHPFFNNKPVPQVPASVSKCIDCNIVFYKHENYLIHKKHYCSGRRNRTSSPGTSSEDSVGAASTPGSKSVELESNKRARHYSSETEISDKCSHKSVSPVIQSPKSDSKLSPDASRPSSIPDEILYRFYCVPCKIKFSSSSTLKAHKKFYCPHGQESEQTVLPKKPLEDRGNSPVIDDGGNFKCDRCDSSFISARLLKLHFCTGITTATPLMRCPYCDFVTHTDVRISDHMKVHMPSKAYRCTLCGYRGNTVRGMRMHGKMHVDSGEEFADENMIEIEEPPLLPVKARHITENGPINMEAELIRLKNEPYKRRRSRKSYEKSENMVIPSERPIVNACALCGQTFTDLRSFALHIRMHEVAALQAAAANSLKCQFCEDLSENFDDLMKHIQSKHPDKFIFDHSNNMSKPESRSEHTSRSNSRASSANSHPDSVNQPASSLSPTGSHRDSNSNIVDIKPEPSENGYGSPMSDSHSKQSIKEEPQDFSDNASNRSSVHSPMSDSKIRENDSFRDEETDKHLISASVKRSEKKSPSPVTSRSYSPVMKQPSPSLKKSPTQNNDSFVQPLNVPVLDSSQMLPYYHLLPGVGPMPRLVPLATSPPTSGCTPPDSRSENSGPQYCRHCDISFKYFATFLAHKKYYCTARPSEELSSPTQA